MNDLEKVYQSALQAIAADHRACEQSITNQILKAQDSNKSKRELLGLNKREAK